MEAMQASDKYSDALTATLGPSRRMGFLCVAAAAMTAGLVVAMPLPLALRILLVTWVACLALEATRRLLATHGLALEPGAVAVDGVAGTLRPGSFVAPWLAIVRWRPAGGRYDRTLFVSPDRLPAAVFRHLRVILKNAPV
jgi:hypothetical protein